MYLVVAPFLEPVKLEFWYAVAYLGVGVLLYFTFAVYKLNIPGISKYIFEQDDVLNSQFFL